MTTSTGARWADLADYPLPLPSFRKVDRWARLGIIGQPAVVGSGFRRVWSDRDLAKLAAIEALSKDLEALGFTPQQGLPASIVAKVWKQFDDNDVAVIHAGMVTLEAEIRPVTS